MTNGILTPRTVRSSRHTQGAPHGGHLGQPVLSSMATSTGFAIPPAAASASPCAAPALRRSASS